MYYAPSEIERFAARFYQGYTLTLTPYAYQTIFLALTQGSQQTNVINIQANQDFIALGFRHRAQIGAAQTISTVTAPFVRFLFTDTGTNENFTNTSVDINNYGPAMPYAFYLPYPKIISGRSAISVQATNYAPTVETYTSIEVSMFGVAVRATRG
jgi:hypothetical protein